MARSINAGLRYDSATHHRNAHIATIVNAERKASHAKTSQKRNSVPRMAHPVHSDCSICGGDNGEGNRWTHLSEGAGW
jgi:hypothetical protein